MAEPLTDEGGEETEYPEKTPDDEFQIGNDLHFARSPRYCLESNNGEAIGSVNGARMSLSEHNEAVLSETFIRTGSDSVNMCMNTLVSHPAFLGVMAFFV